MRTFLRSKVTLLFLTLGMLLAVPAVAWAADNLTPDGDGLTPVATNALNAGSVPCNSPTNKSVALALIHSGGANNTFQNSSTVTVTVDSVTGSGLSASMGSPNTITLPSNWESGSNGAQSAIVNSTVTINPSVAGPGVGTVNYTATGTEATAGGGGPLTRTGTLSVSWNAGSCDTTAPTSTHSLSPAANADGWNNSNVTVTLNATDGGSGVQKIRYSTSGAQTTAETTYDSTSKPVISTEGTTTVSYYAVDNAGNIESAHTFQVKVDKTAPVVNCDSADGNWHGANVNIACTASDVTSDLADSNDASFNLSTSVAAGSEDSNASTDSHDVYDNAGNFATGGPVSGNKVDRKAPGFSCPAADGDWHATDQTFNCTASDGGSGLNPTGDANFSLSTSVAAGSETNNASTGTKTLTDAVGNSVTAPAITGVKVDKKGPAITITTPASGAVYTLGQTINAAYSCPDGGSGTASCTGPVASGSAIDTNSLLSHSFTVNATDNVGNPATLTNNYSVAAAFNGFLQPIDGTMVNTGKFGRVYPVKWQLKDSSQNLISDAAAEALVSSMTVKQVTANCTTGAADALETEAGAAGSTSVRYDATSDQFIFNYKAPSSGSCYSLNIYNADGVNTKTILFKFTK